MVSTRSSRARCARNSTRPMTLAIVSQNATVTDSSGTNAPPFLGANPGQLYAQLQKAGRLPEIERSITEEKVFKYLMEQNTVE